MQLGHANRNPHLQLQTAERHSAATAMQPYFLIVPGRKYRSSIIKIWSFCNAVKLWSQRSDETLDAVMLTWFFCQMLKCTKLRGALRLRFRRAPLQFHFKNVLIFYKNAHSTYLLGFFRTIANRYLLKYLLHYMPFISCHETSYPQEGIYCKISKMMLLLTD